MNPLLLFLITQSMVWNYGVSEDKGINNATAINHHKVMAKEFASKTFPVQSSWSGPEAENIKNFFEQLSKVANKSDSRVALTKNFVPRSKL